MASLQAPRQARISAQDATGYFKGAQQGRIYASTCGYFGTEVRKLCKTPCIPDDQCRVQYIKVGPPSATSTHAVVLGGSLTRVQARTDIIAPLAGSTLVVK